MQKKITANQQIKLVDFEYKKLLLHICRDIIKKYQGLPIEPEDVYYEFLYYVPKIFNDFDSEKGNFLFYLKLRFKSFTKNKCRQWMSGKHKIMNFYVKMDFDRHDKKSDLYTSDYDIFDKTKLTTVEKIVYQYYFLDKISRETISNKLSISSYRCSKIIETLKTKIYHSIKN